MMKSQGLLNGEQQFGRGAAQVLLHGEAHSIMRAWKHANGALPNNITVYVDRSTCSHACRPFLGEVAEVLGIDHLTIIMKNGEVLNF